MEEKRKREFGKGKFFDRAHDKKEFEEKVVEVSRVSRTVAGGRRIRFRVAVAIGNKKGKVGIGIAKSNEVVNGVSKAVKIAKKRLIEVPLVKGTIPHEIQTNFGGAKVLLKPAAPGTGLIAGGAVRVVASLCGVTDLSAKILGSSNKINCLKAIMSALEQLANEEKLKGESIKEKEEMAKESKAEKQLKTKKLREETGKSLKTGNKQDETKPTKKSRKKS